MRLNHGRHLAYSANVHRGETWPETFQSLNNCALALRESVHPGRPFGIGLRLSRQAAGQLSERRTLAGFRRWLEKNDCYVFTINGFPYGRFHGASVKENVYRPDWTASDRLAYTCLLFDLLAALLPAGVEGSVSTLAGSFKEFDPDAAARKRIFDNLWRCARHAARAGGRFGRALRLGLEPEPLCLMENADETVRFFDELRAHCKNDPRVEECIGVNYDTCHFAIAFEEPRAALSRLVDAGIKISKIQLSSALKARPTIAARQKLKEFADEIYLHQVAVRDETGRRAVHRDLPDALAGAAAGAGSSEWRIHFHVPLHAPAVAPLETTADDLLRTLDWLAGNPRICSHLEMETYTWDVLPPELKARTVVSQLLAEYRWTLHHLAKRGLGALESD